jgi:hypothetical protein
MVMRAPFVVWRAPIHGRLPVLEHAAPVMAP